jgi:hypothetical protein
MTHCIKDRQNFAPETLVKVDKLVTKVTKQVIGIIEAFRVTIEAETGSQTLTTLKDHGNTVSHTRLARSCRA